METPAAYAPELARYVVDHWPADTPLRLPLARLVEALSVAFQASLTFEEARPLRFRLLLAHATSLPPSGDPNVTVLPLPFARSRALGVEELRRLAPAAPFESSLIGVAEEGGRLAIWGLAHSGPAWLAPAWGGRSVVPIWSRDPIVHVTGPGQLAVRSAGRLIGALERGALVDTAMDVFESAWLPAAFARERDEIRVGLAVRPETSLVARVSQHMLRRCIQIIRGAHHGGLVLLADSSCALGADASTILRGVRLKYRFVDGEAPRRYRAVLTRIVEHVAALSGARAAEWADFANADSPELARLEQAVFEWSRLVANLAAVDGAVVLDKRFALVGFGAEVSTELPSPEAVYRALDLEGARRERRDLEDVGTRHRAAYRFVHGHPRGLAIVVSQDGGVTFVANRDGEVVFWPQSVSP